MLQWVKCLWTGKVSPETTTSSYCNAFRLGHFYHGFCSPKVTPSEKVGMTTRISESWYSQRKRSRNDDRSTKLVENHVQTSVKTVENHQEIITTIRTAKIFKKTILIQQVPSSTTTDSSLSVVKKHQESVSLSSHSLETSTRIPLPLDNSICSLEVDKSLGYIGHRSSSTRKLSTRSLEVDESLDDHPLTGRRSSSTRKLSLRKLSSRKPSLSSIAEHQSGLVEELRLSSLVVPETPLSV